MARRALLPGQPDSDQFGGGSLDDWPAAPWSRSWLEDSGLSIVTYGAGDAVGRDRRAHPGVRNTDTGVIIRGVVQPDGTVKVVGWIVAEFLLALILLVSAASAQAAVRIKDIADIKGLRENQIVGYGLVIGLNGTGDTLRNAPFTEEPAIDAREHGHQRQDETTSTNNPPRPTTLRTRNVAAVMVTADLAPSIGAGERMDVTVSSLGDATSLLGGTLVMTSLRAADGAVYAVAQGAVTVAGYSVGGQAQNVSQGTPTAGRIPNGALVEREVQGSLHEMEFLVLELKNPDFVTATRILDAINGYAGGRYRAQIAFERDYRTIVLSSRAISAPSASSPKSAS